MAIKLTELDPTEAARELAEARVLNRAGHTLARIIGEFDWDPDLHPRHEAGSSEGGRFRKGLTKRGSLRKRASLSSLQIGQALGRPTPGGVSTAPTRPAPTAPWRHESGALMRPTTLPGGMWSPPGGWTSTEESDHPKYDSDFPGKGGKLIRVGDLFNMDGKEWEVSHIVMGHLIVDESSGKKSKVETRIIDPKTVSGKGTIVSGLTPVKPRKIKGGAGKKTGGSSTVRIVDPYNLPETHDPGLELPKNSPLSAEQWQQFGRVEQLHYQDVMQRYGSWKSDAPIQSLINSVLNDYDADIVGMVKSAYQKQYGTSTGGTLSLTAFTGTAAKMEKRSKAMDLQGRLRDVIAWDLYNRTKSPDLMVFHGSEDSVSWWKKLIGQAQVFSGVSQSFNIDPTHSFGSNKLATPLSIRHICFATTVTSWVGDYYSWEHEIAIVPQFKADLKKSMLFNWGSIGPAAKKWLTNISKHPKAGSTLGLLRAHLDHGDPLPVTVDPEVSFPQAGKKPPNPAALEALEEYGKELPNVQDWTAAELGKKGMPWKYLDESGAPGLMSGTDASVKPGDFVVGQKGTLYWLDDHQTLHMIVADANGKLAFNNEQYDWNGQHKNYFLKGNVQPLKDADAPDFDPGAWQYAAEDKKAISKMDVGEKFKVDGQTYEKVAQGDINTTPIKDCSTGKQGSINSAYQTVVLVPAAGHHVSTTLQPEKGMTLSYDGKKHKVTAVKKDGTVSVKAVGEPVKVLPGDDPALDALFNPDVWTIGDKTSLANLQVGDMFHGGTGSQTIKPYKVVAVEGTKILWQNLDTGEKNYSYGHKKVKQLVPNDGTAEAAEKKKPEAEGLLAQIKAASEEIAQEKAEAEDGDGFAGTPDGETWKFGDLPVGAQYHLANLNGKPIIMTKVGPGVAIWPDGKKLNGVFAGVEVKKVPGTVDNLPTGTVVKAQGGDFEFTVDKGELVANASGAKSKPPPGWVPEIVSLPGVELPPNPNEQPGESEGMLKDIGEDMVGAVIEVPAGSDLTPAGPAKFEVTQTPGGSLGLKHDKGTFSVDVIKTNGSTDAYKVVEPPPFEAPVAVAKGYEALPEAMLNAYASAWGSGGKYKHDRIVDMPEGTVFQDKNKKLWKVQVSDALAVITDGEKNYKVDGTLRGRKVEAHLPNVDPPLQPETYSSPKDKADSYAGPTLDPPSVIKPLLGDNLDGTPLIGLLKKGEPMNYTVQGELFHWNGKSRFWVKPDGSTVYLDATTDIVGHSWTGTVPDKIQALDQGEKDPDFLVWDLHKDETFKYGGKTWKVAGIGYSPNGGEQMTFLDEDGHEYALSGTAKVGDLGQYIGASASPDGEALSLDTPPFEMAGKTWEVTTVGNSVWLQGGAPDADVQIVKLDKPATKKDLELKLAGGQVGTMSPSLATPTIKAATQKTLNSLYEEGDEFEVEGKPFKLVAKLEKGGGIALQTDTGDLIPYEDDAEPTKLLNWTAPDPPQPEPDMAKDLDQGVPTGLLQQVSALTPSELAALPPAPWDFYGSIWGSGAKWKHWRLDELKPGTHFKPKGEPTGDYVLVKSLVGGKVLVYRPQGGDFVVAPGEGRVRLVDE